MKTRIDKLLEDLKEKELYSDFHNSFLPHPVSGKIQKLTNEQAIIQGVKNRIKTMFGERLYDPQFGSNIYNSLFEPNDEFLKESIEKSIRNSLQNDDRVSILNVFVEIIDVNINIDIVVLISNNTNPIKISVIIRRAR